MPDLSPEELAKSGSEHANQVALFAWMALQFSRHPELRHAFAIPNGGERNKIVAANLKAEGVRRGVSDIFIPVVRGPWHGLFVELKVGKNKPTEEQYDFMADMRAAGYGACWCIGWQHAAQTILDYLEWKYLEWKDYA